MAMQPAKKADSYARILASAGRGFRRHGYGGLGIDGLAKAAGVTSGAFYAHFTSKAAAFRAAVVAGMEELKGGIEQFRATRGQGWRQGLVDFYLTERTTCDIGESCALQTLTGEVARSNDDVRHAYEAGLRAVIEAAAEGDDTAGEAERRAAAIALLSLLVGGVSVARAVTDPALRAEIVAAIRTQATTMIDTPLEKASG